MSKKQPKPLDIDRELKHAQWGMYVFYALMLLAGIANASAIYLERERGEVRCFKKTTTTTPPLIDGTPAAADQAARPPEKSVDRQREEPKP